MANKRPIKMKENEIKVTGNFVTSDGKEFTNLVECANYCHANNVTWKENEPKVKDSQKFWKVNSVYIYTGSKYKSTYDRLVSLEAKIEVLQTMINLYERPSMSNDLPDWTTQSMHYAKAAYESELAQLVKELKL